MTVSATPSFTVSIGTGALTVFNYGFRVLDSSHLKVTVDGVIVVPTAVTGVGADLGGTFTLGTAPANGAQVRASRAMPYSRSTDYQFNGVLPEDTLDADQDAPVLMIQQLSDALSRAPILPETSALVNPGLPVPGAGKFIRWNLTGTALEAIDGTGTTPGDFVASGSTAVPRTISSKLGDIISAKDHGLVGDGVTDDTAALQALINSLSMPRRIHFPAGVYIISSTITIPTALLQQGQVDRALAFTGDGIGVTTIRCNNNVVMFTATAGPALGGSNMSWRDITFLRSGLTATQWIHSYTGIALITFERCYFWSDDTNTANETGVFLQGNGTTAPSWEHIFRDCRFSGASISLLNSADTWIDNCQIYPVVADGVSGGRNYGIKINGGGDIKIRSHIGAAPNGAIWFTGGTSYNAVVNCFFDTCANTSFLYHIFGSPTYTTFTSNIHNASPGSAVRVTDMLLCTWVGNQYVSCPLVDNVTAYPTIDLLNGGTGCQQNFFFGEQFNHVLNRTNKVFAIRESAGSGSSRLYACNFNGLGPTQGYQSYPLSFGAPNNNTLLDKCLGANNKARGNATIGAASTSVVVSHGLIQAPENWNIHIHPLGSMGAAASHWISGITTTQFTINVNVAPGGGGFNFDWTAGYRLIQ